MKRNLGFGFVVKPVLVQQQVINTNYVINPNPNQTDTMF